MAFFAARHRSCCLAWPHDGLTSFLSFRYGYFFDHIKQNFAFMNLSVMFIKQFTIVVTRESPSFGLCIQYPISPTWQAVIPYSGSPYRTMLGMLCIFSSRQMSSCLLLKSHVMTFCPVVCRPWYLIGRRHASDAQRR